MIAARSYPRAAAAAALALAALSLLVVLWALGDKTFPGLHVGPLDLNPGDRFARLREPVDYWNALALVAGSAITPMPALAHHSFAAEFDMDQPIKLRGTVTEVEFMNPHSWIHIDVKKDDGTVESWAIEGGTPNTLLRRGLTRDTLKVGTEIIVDGYQTKDHSLKRANGRDVTFTNGQKIFMGSSGTGAPRDGRDPTEVTKKPGGN